MRLSFLFLLVFYSCNTLYKGSHSDQTLKSKYQKDFMIGVAMSQDIVDGKDTLSALIVKTHFNAITPENVMKAEILNPSPQVYDFTHADAFVEYGLKNNMFIIGHTLVWHNQCPDWFFTRENGEKRTSDEVKVNLHNYIKTVAGRYHNKVNAWDVVNEVIGDDGEYRKTRWVEGIGNGDTLVQLAFTYAAQYAPNTELYYNDFNAWKPAKRDGIIKMVKMLQSAGIRIDGVGIQGHWGLNYPENKYIEDAIIAYANAGMKVMITELDIDVLPLTKEGQIIGTGMLHPQFQEEEFKLFLDPYKKGLPMEIEKKQADRYKELFALFHKHKDKITRVSLWGVHDGMSWKNDYPIPNRTNYPLLWDRNKKPKKSFFALQQLVGSDN